MKDFSIVVSAVERSGLARAPEAVRVGIPCPKGLIDDPSQLALTDAAERLVPHQSKPLAWWSDGSIKWLLLDALVEIGAGERVDLSLRTAPASAQTTHVPRIVVSETEKNIQIDTGAATFVIDRQGSGLFAAARVGATNLLAAKGSSITLRTADGAEYRTRIDSVVVEESGPIRASVLMRGELAGERGSLPLQFHSRLMFVAGATNVRLDFRIRNPQAAQHVDGLWDLGDRGSVFFKDVSVKLFPSVAPRSLRWYAEPGQRLNETAPAAWSLYQDSSGGERWNSPNHVDSSGASTVKFRGYQIRGGSESPAGDRATPCLLAMSDSGWIAATAHPFWQNFPKALRWDGEALAVGLFPAESSEFELQGGEQKRHTVLLDFGLPEHVTNIPQLQQPLLVSVAPAWIEHTAAVSYFAHPEQISQVGSKYASYLQQAIEGPHSLVGKREVIDEYGWRNFGDLYGDHEAVRHSGPTPFISHYNNQYDFVYGALLQFLRTGDGRWRELMDDLARHVIDIDIYHTDQDKAAFNGGLFWHTDHYQPAATCTHRTYSRANAGGGDYGGGPSNEHNYTSGLLHYYFLTGDAESAESVMTLANWVLSMDEGADTLLGLVDAGPTGVASQTVATSFHKPGRGAGNSINALLDAYTLSGKRAYFAKAEELIQRCIHPSDDIDALGLTEPEYRWSYLVFLQVLAKYVETKRELGELDYHFHYGIESLCHYARWMAAHEVPYKDVLHKVEIPTESWPAQDIRKAHVLYAAAKYVSDEEHARWRERASFFAERCIQDLESFETAYLCRPVVIQSVYGMIPDYFERHAERVSVPRHNHRFGEPVSFVPQRERFRGTLKHRLRVASQEVRRLLGNRYRKLVGGSGRQR